ncbi:hypothetical protein KOI35_36975 [Actinoplanes bogorensis]|uniref:Uncharacterized protein n=1 Tax=Paractinoplanes bogorensis TaxID=1610840 RepID=A0ABS5Z0E9_9ACTN|nr:hypothetical protein [Actinoplanes bogorensis]MBU2669122.1 hypothetical protein [Actinoplanes bogorensis]
MENDDTRTADPAYAASELARAYATATGHDDEPTRRRADERVRRWSEVLSGMLSGVLSIGSRAPVAGLPAWVTPEVVRGGFATGRAAAAIDDDGGARFDHYLSEEGLAELSHLLDSGAYRIELPEHAALLTIAWLLRAGDRDAAVAVLKEIAPYTDRLRFSPEPSQAPVTDPDIVWRETAAQARDRLARRTPDPRVEAQREALTVWNPFADELLTLWCETVVDGRVAVTLDDEWRVRAGALLRRYEQLAAAHTRCTKHRRPKENLAVLRRSLQESVSGGELSTRGLLQHAVDSMLARRGRPGSAPHAALRARQAAQTARPSHHELAQLLVRRLAAHPPSLGIAGVDAVLAGAEFPESLRKAVERARAGTVEELVATRVIGSAEVLAGLVPQLAAATAAAPYREKALRTLMAATYRAFRNRRSLLLLNLERQVRLGELPWVRAVEAHRVSGDDTRDAARATLQRLGQVAVDAFPGTQLPNPLVRELSALSREAGDGLPWVSELAADIFEGRFAASFPAAATIAADLLEGTLYERYYGIDYAHVPSTSPTFDALCRDRAGTRSRSSVAANGTVIEQAQILTTHNLATLVARAGVRPAPDCADRAFATANSLARRLPGNPRPLSTVKDIAYAWRQLIFFVSLTGDAEARLARWTRDAEPVLAPALAGLAHAAAGGTVGTGRRLLGWTTGPHWLVTRE